MIWIPWSKWPIVYTRALQQCRAVQALHFHSGHTTWVEWRQQPGPGWGDNQQPLGKPVEKDTSHVTWPKVTYEHLLIFDSFVFFGFTKLIYNQLWSIKHLGYFQTNHLMLDDLSWIFRRSYWAAAVIAPRAPPCYLARWSDGEVGDLDVWTKIRYGGVAKILSSMGKYGYNMV